LSFLVPSSIPANDNADRYATPEGAYFQIRKARRRHLGYDTAAMTPGRFRQWREVLAGLDQAERELLPLLRRPSGQRAGSAPPAASGRRPRGLARLRRRLRRLLRRGRRG
jgi:hypothetical protein